MDTLDAHEPVATAEIPLLEGLRLEWTRRLLRGDPYISMQGLIYKMGEEAAKLPPHLISSYSMPRYDEDDAYVDGASEDMSDDMSEDSPGAPSEAMGYSTRTERFLKEALKTPQNSHIFNAIPRDMLKSIVLGTVAWDYYPRASRTPPGCYKTPKKRGYGIYVFGLAVEGRDGKWLTANELNRLIKDLRTYVLGYDMYMSNGGAWPNTSLARVETRDLVAEVDSQLIEHRTLVTGPRFVASEHGRQGLVDLIASLQRRADKSLEINPAGETPLIQTPIYTGLSSDLASRMPKHDVNSKDGLKSSNKAHGLICSLMKLQGLQPRAVSVVAVRLWEKDDLWFSETLVCALANSLISQDGFNRTECGSKVASDAPRLDPAGEDMSSFLHDNLEATLVELRQRKAFLEEFRKLDSVMSDPILQEARDANEKYKESSRVMKTLPDYIHELEKQLQREEQELKDAQKGLEFLELLSQFKDVDLSGLE
ncbi:hypothetical protein VPNG_09714 [Cytospora leucostoma]|uniref:Uncharacterized protein n=1 Tax=Cytospora leucostoma TaxID=1230097 RepID=A0A423VKN6_9PEZI|nr:hypothetical protein VPNG_09714 [Cytospora leucostoma]